MISRIARLGSVAAAFGLAGCGSLTQETSHATALAQAMTTDHSATIALLNRANSAMLPYVLEQATLPSRVSFAKADFSVLAVSDIAAWDKILAGLDSYCAALAALTSGKGANTLATASATFGTNIKALTQAAKIQLNPAETTAASALAAIADLLIREKAGRDAQAIARQADPAFQTILADLTTALEGVQRSYETDYISSTMPQRLKEFPGDAIAGFQSLTAAERKAKIAQFSSWLATEQAHDDLILAFGALKLSLAQTATAHRALAAGGNPNLAGIFADLQAEVQNVRALCQ